MPIPAISIPAVQRFFVGIGGMLAASFIPMLTVGNRAIGGNAVTAYGTVALLLAIFGPAFLAFTVSELKNRELS